MAGKAASVTTTGASSSGQSKSNMAGLLGYSLCVLLLVIAIQQLSTHLDWYQFSTFPLS
jgi:hypothetical protein